MDETALPALDTNSALGLAGISRATWDNLMTLDAYKAAPTAKAGHTRWFTVDDCVGLYCIRWLLDLGYRQTIAGRTANAIRRAMKTTPDAEVLTVVTMGGPKGVPVAVARAAAPGEYAFQFPIAKMKVEIARAVARLPARP